MSRSLDVAPEVKVLLRGDGQVPGQRSLPRPQATAPPLAPPGDRPTHPAAGVSYIS